MTSVKITPTRDVPLPLDLEDETKQSNFLDELNLAVNTAEFKEVLGGGPEISMETLEKEKELLRHTIENQRAANLQRPNTAFAAAAFLKTYGAQLALDVAQARAAITNKLMELANCGDAKIELKALELLGKHRDIGLFTERSEININVQDPDRLEERIKEKVKRLLHAEVIDVTPLHEALDEELGPAPIERGAEIPKEWDDVLDGDGLPDPEPADADDVEDGAVEDTLDDNLLKDIADELDGEIE